MAITLYTPEMESYAMDDYVLFKIEKIMLQEKDEEVTISYIGVESHGMRSIFDENETLFTMNKNSGEISDEQLFFILADNEWEGASNVIEELKFNGISKVVRANGCRITFEEYMEMQGIQD